MHRHARASSFGALVDALRVLHGAGAHVAAASGIVAADAPSSSTARDSMVPPGFARAPLDRAVAGPAELPDVAYPADYPETGAETAKNRPESCERQHRGHGLCRVLPGTAPISRGNSIDRKPSGSLACSANAAAASRTLRTTSHLYARAKGETP